MTSLSLEELRRRLHSSRRVLVVGCNGAGKTHLARALGESLRLPVIHMDRHFFRPNWLPLDAESWRKKVTELVSADSWIIDGSYSSTFPIRFPRADAIIDLCLPRWLCFSRVILRSVMHLGTRRSDTAEGCRERIDLEFFRWAWNYHKRTAPKIPIAARELAPTAAYCRLTSAREVDKFIKSLNNTAGQNDCNSHRAL